jgi:hypothetical protein
LEKGQRNFELIHSLITDAQSRGEVTSAFTSDELTRGIYGMFNLQVMGYLVDQRQEIDDVRARQIVRLFFEGAGIRGGVRSQESGVRGEKK